MKFKVISKIVALISFFGMTLGAMGVYANWQYAIAPIVPVKEEVLLDFNTFFWDGVEVLPDNPLLGESHFYLVENIVETELGINNPNSHLSEVIESRIDNSKDNVSSVAPTTGGNLKPIFSMSEIAYLDFYITIYVDDDNQPYAYDLYTFETIYGTNAGGNVNPVFKTVIEKVDGVFKAIHSYKGKASTKYYDTKQGGGKSLTVNPDTWDEI